MVEAHVASCARCLQEIEALVELETALHQIEGRLELPVHGRDADPGSERDSDRRLDRLWARIEAGGIPATPPRRPRRSRWSRPTRLLVAAQAFTIAALLALPFVDGGPDEAMDPRLPRFETRSAAEAKPASARFQVVFSPEATEPALRAALASVEGEILGGPTPQGRYFIGVPAGFDQEATLTRLRAEPVVWFVEPIGPP